jgi:UDP-N-acetylmuramate--alanine ligase
MKALAEILVGLGWKVAGSDLAQPSPAIQAMERRGLRIHHGHHVQHIGQGVDVVVYSPAVSAENPERQSAASLGIPQLSYTQMLGWLMQSRTGVCIAGTHGKSTTTAMTACILRDAGLAPSAVFGAELCGSGLSGWAGAGEHFVVESCEFKKSFLDLSPRIAAVLNVEPDHFDCFSDFAATRQAFEEFVAKLPADGVLVARGDSEATQQVARTSPARVVTFSDQPGSDWWAADVRPVVGGNRFRVFYRGDYYAEITLQVPGLHNVQNALAAIAIAEQAGVKTVDIRESLGDFRGVKRRFESVGTWRGITLFDDYAHHPTAVQATLKAARERAGRRKLWCIFQPHQISRTRALMAEFAQSFGDANETLIVPVFAAREQFAANEPEMTSAELALKIGQSGTKARFSASLDRIIATVDDEVRPGDVLVTMGAGDINRVHHEFARQLRRHRPAG